MELHEGMTVKTADGDKVGTVDRIVIDPTSSEVTHIIVQKGLFFTEDRVIPITATLLDDYKSLRLIPAVENLYEFPKFEEKYYIEPGYQNKPYTDWSMQPLFHYPPAVPKTLPHADEINSQVPKQSTQNIPDGRIVVSEGTKVISYDDHYAGDVEKIVTDDHGKVTHLLISKGILFTTNSLIPIGWVSRLGDDEIKLHVHTEVVEDLPEHEA